MNRKAVRAIHLLTKRERKLFSKFLASSTQSNEETQLSLFWKLLLGRIQKNNLADLTPEEVANSLKVKTKNPGLLANKLYSQLYQEINRFLTQSEFDLSDPSKTIFLLRAYNKRPLSELSENEYKSGKKLLEEKASTGDEELEQSYQLEREYGVYLFRKARSSNEEQLDQISESLHKTYFSKLLELALARLNNQTVFPSSRDQFDFSIIEFLESKFEGNIPGIIGLRLMAYKVLKGSPDFEFDQLLAEINAVSTEVSTSDRQQIYIICINHLLLQTNKGNQESTMRLEALYSALVENGMLLDNGKLPEQHFKNIVSIQCKLGLIDKAISFVDRFHPILKSFNREKALLYNRSIIQFYSGDFTGAAKSFYNIVGELRDDVFYVHDARAFRIMALTELDRFMEVESAIEAFYKYLSRQKKIKTDKKKATKAFLKILEKIVRWRQLPTQRTPEKIEQLRRKVDDSEIPNKAWLHKMIDRFLGPGI